MRISARRWLGWLVYGLTAAFILIPLAPALLGQGTLLDVGALSAVLPFRAELGANWASAVVCRSDTFDYYMPGIAEIKRSVLAGHFPVWAPYEVGGAPLASLPNHGAFSPMSLPYWVLPLWLAPAYVKLLEFVVAIGGMVLYLRRIGVTRTAGLVAGMVFASSGFMIMWTNWPHTRVAALIPALFWALERVVQECRARDVVLVAAVVASMLLGGFPAIVLYAHTLAAPYVLVRVLVLYRGHRLRTIQTLAASAGGVILGVGISAVQIVPFAAYLGSLDLSARERTGDHLPLYAAFTLVDPAAIGTCVGGQRFGPYNPVEAIGYLGCGAVVIAAAAVLVRRQATDDEAPRLFMAISAVILGTAIWLGGPALALLQVLPMWSSSFIGRAQSTFAFVVAVLVGLAFDRLLRGVAPKRQTFRLLGHRSAVRLALVASVLAILAVLVTRAIVTLTPARDFAHHLWSTVPVPIALLSASIVLTAVAARGTHRARLWALATLATLIVAQAAAFANTQLPTSRRQDFYPTTPTHRFLSAHLGAERYGAGDNTMLPATSDFYNLRTPVGHEFTDARWKDLLTAVDPKSRRTVTYSTFAATPIKTAMTSPLLDQLAVRYWVASPRRAVGDKDRLPADNTGDLRLAAEDRASCQVAGGPIRGVRLDVAQEIAASPPGTRPMVHVTVTSGDIERSGSVLIDSGVHPGPLFVAVAGEDLPDSDTARVAVWLTDVTGDQVFGGSGDHLACAAVRPERDGLRLVQSDAGGAVYERVQAMPRIRWASQSQVVTDGRERVALLEDGLGEDTVLVEDASLPLGEGRPGEVAVLRDEPETITARVNARGAGYLVIADSIVRPGWMATVDGVPTPIVAANHAFGGVAVPGGEHTVELSYAAPGLRLGLTITIISLLLAAIPVVGPIVAHRRRRAGRTAGNGPE